MRTSKYGASIRKLHDKAVRSQRASHECPKCHKPKLKRKGNSLWMCGSCGATLSGGAYSPRTEAGEISARIASDYSKQE